MKIASRYKGMTQRQMYNLLDVKSSRFDRCVIQIIELECEHELIAVRFIDDSQIYIYL